MEKRKAKRMERQNDQIIQNEMAELEKIKTAAMIKLIAKDYRQYDP